MRYTDFHLAGPIVQAPRRGTTPGSVNRRGFDFDSDRDLFAFDNQLEGVFDTDRVEHRFVAGVDYQRFNDVQGSENLFGLDPVNPFNPVFTGTVTPFGSFFTGDNQLTEWGLYGQYRAEIADTFVAVAGLRHSDVENERASSFGGGAVSTVEQDDTATTFNGALMWLGPNGFTPYVSYSESFEPQVGNDPLANGDIVPPSEGDQIELGLRWENADDTLSAQASAFRIDQTNIVNGDPGNPGFSILVDGQRHEGIELEASGQLFDHLRLQAGYTHLDAEITNSNNGDVGLSPVLVPEHSASAFATLDGELFGVPDGFALAGIRYVSERRASATVDLPNFTLVDLGAGYDFGTFSLQLNVKNVFDERYFTGEQRFAIDGQPRVFQGTLKANF